MNKMRRNWAGNYAYQAEHWHFPETVEQLQEVVRQCQKVRVIGSRHSFNGIADSTKNILSLSRLGQVVEIDRVRRRVTVDGGMRYGGLCQALHEAGFALHNLASLPHISVVGACATATHGSGDGNGNLATAVAALELVMATGDLISLSRERDSEQFSGAVVNLGALGAVAKITLDIQPAFTVCQNVYENLSMAQLVAHSEEVFASGYSVSLFTNWQNENFNQVWLKRRVTAASNRPATTNLFGATAVPTQRHPIVTLSAENCTEQMGRPGPWHERLPHFRMDFMPSSGDELQSEYFVPRQYGLAALQTVMQLHAQVTPLLYISEVRTVAADDLWLSPCHQQDCMAIHFTWRQDWTAVRQFLPILEEKLAPYQAIPHWGKLFTMSPTWVQSFYTRLPEFQRLRQKYDPLGKFHNAFLEETIGAPK